MSEAMMGASPNMKRNEEARAAIREMDDYDEVSAARIGSQLGFMQGLISDTHAMVSELSKSIEQILIPESDEVMKNETPAPPRKPSSELSNTIDDMNSQIRRLQRRLQGIIERVQL